MLGCAYDEDQLDLYFAVRTAFLDRPEARISTDRDKYGNVWVWIDERLPVGIQLWCKAALSPEGLFVPTRKLVRMMTYNIADRMRHDYEPQLQSAQAKFFPCMLSPHSTRLVKFIGGSKAGTEEWFSSPPSVLVHAPTTMVYYDELENLSPVASLETEHYQLGRLGDGTYVYRFNGWQG